MASATIPRNATVGRAVRRTVAAMLEGKLGALVPDDALGACLAQQLEGERLAIVATEVAADLARDLPHAPIDPHFWERLDRLRTDLLRAVDERVEGLRALSAGGEAAEAAAQIYAVLDAATEAVREIKPPAAP